MNVRCHRHRRRIVCSRLDCMLPAACTGLANKMGEYRQTAVDTKCCLASDDNDSDAGTLHVLLFVQQIVYNGQVNNEIQFASNGIYRRCCTAALQLRKWSNFIHFPVLAFAFRSAMAAIGLAFLRKREDGPVWNSMANKKRAECNNLPSGVLMPSTAWCPSIFHLPIDRFVCES